MLLLMMQTQLDQTVKISDNPTAQQRFDTLVHISAISQHEVQTRSG